MKTKNNVQKSVRKSLGIIACLLFIIFSIDAQDISILEREIFSAVNSTMLNGSNILKRTMNNNTSVNSIPAYLIEENEEELRLEDWMFDESNFYSANNVAETANVNESTEMNSFNSEPEIEEELKLEAWMFDERNFDTNPGNGTTPKNSEINNSLPDTGYKTIKLKE